MDLNPWSHSSGLPRLPRTRGDGPDWQPIGIGRELASPHTRGWTLALRHRIRQPIGFPAHAGMDRCSRSGAGCSSRLPPHTRGWTWSRPMDVRYSHGFPAHAGMDPLRPLAAVGAERLPPHTRGWTPIGHDQPAVVHGFPPHTRGWTRFNARHRGEGGGFPRTRGDGPVAWV